MKREGEQKGNWGEGWLIAVALLIVLTLSVCTLIACVPLEETVNPIHYVDAERISRMEMINLNTASVEELENLPGIGKVLAERIVVYRDTKGFFTSAEELLEVEGIGEGKLQGVMDRIYIE